MKLLKWRMFSSDHWQMGWWSSAPALLNWEHGVCSLNDLLINRMHPAVTLLFMRTRRNFQNITVSIVHSQRQLKQNPVKLPNCHRDSESEHNINLTRISLHLFLCLFALLSPFLCLSIPSEWISIFCLFISTNSAGQIPPPSFLSNLQGSGPGRDLVLWQLV